MLQVFAGHFLKLTAKAPENVWLEDDFVGSIRSIFRGELLVLRRDSRRGSSSSLPKHPFFQGLQ